MIYPFSYEVILYIDTNSYTLECGMGFAENFSDAAKQIEDYYGSDIVSIKDIYLFEDSSLMIMPRDFIKQYKNISYVPATPCDADGYPLGQKKEVIE